MTAPNFFAHQFFAAGSVVLVTLHAPREKYWGMLLAVSPEGLSLCGIDLNSFEDFVQQVKDGEAGGSIMFFPMHRVERVELDSPAAAAPSLRQRFESRTGMPIEVVLAVSPPGGSSA